VANNRLGPKTMKNNTKLGDKLGKNMRYGTKEDKENAECRKESQ
jgi:hypothetical protein